MTGIPSDMPSRIGGDHQEFSSKKVDFLPSIPKKVEMGSSCEVSLEKISSSVYFLQPFRKVENVMIPGWMFKIKEVDINHLLNFLEREFNCKIPLNTPVKELVTRVEEVMSKERQVRDDVVLLYLVAKVSLGL